MHIKLNDIKNISKDNTTELSVLDNYNNLVIKKEEELISATSENMLSNNTIELIFIFDRSSSLIGTEKDMSKYINNLINKYKMSNLNILFTLILFSDNDEQIYYRVPINDVKKINYIASGSTSLYDVLFKNLNNLFDSQIEDGLINNKTIVTIFTDGNDTSSKVCTEYDVSNVIKYTKNYGWEYIFLTKKNQSLMGIENNHIGIYGDNLKECFNSIEKAINDFITTGKLQNNWNASLGHKVLKLTKEDSSDE